MTTRTVSALKNLIGGVVLLITFCCGGVPHQSLRSAIIVAATIPFALATAVLILSLRGESANLLSVGAVDFGLVVDASVIMVELISIVTWSHGHHHCTNAGPRLLPPPRKPLLRDRARRGRGEPGNLLFRRHHHHKLRSPVHPDRRQSRGTIFGPMAAETYAYAIAGGLIATFSRLARLVGTPAPRSAGRDGDADRSEKLLAVDLWKAQGLVSRNRQPRQLTLSAVPQCWR